MKYIVLVIEPVITDFIVSQIYQIIKHIAQILPCKFIYYMQYNKILYFCSFVVPYDMMRLLLVVRLLFVLFKSHLDISTKMF